MTAEVRVTPCDSSRHPLLSRLFVVPPSPYFCSPPSPLPSLIYLPPYKQRELLTCVAAAYSPPHQYYYPILHPEKTMDVLDNNVIVVESREGSSEESSVVEINSRR